MPGSLGITMHYSNVVFVLHSCITIKRIKRFPILLQYIAVGSKKAIDINNKRCGVLNITDLNTTREAELCKAPQPDNPADSEAVSESFYFSLHFA